MCKGNAPLAKVKGTVVCSLPPLLTALVEISFSSVGRAMAYNARGLEIAFFGGKTCSIVTNEWWPQKNITNTYEKVSYQECTNNNTFPCHTKGDINDS